MTRGHGRVFIRHNSPFLWIAYCRNGKEIRESTELADTGKNRKKAERMLDQKHGEMVAEKHGGRPFVGPAEKRVTVNLLLDALEQDYAVRDKSNPQFLSHLKRIREAFGFWRAVNLTAQPEAIDAYVNSCKQAGAAPATVNRGLQLIGQAYKLAIERKLLTSAPSIRHLSECNVRLGFFESADFAAVVESLPDYLQDFARFGYTVGWRKGEVISLEWTDVDDEVVRLRPEHSKNGHGRTVPLFDADGRLSEVGEIIERRRAARTVETDIGPQLAAYVFHRDGLPIGDTRKAWATACRKAGLVGKLFHDFRRTAVRNMVRAGVSEGVAMSITGHKTRAMFDRYNITSENDRQQALGRTRDYLASATKKRNVAVMRKAAGK